MKLRLIDFLTGSCIMKADGTFAERVINIAKEQGIFISNIVRCNETSITFTISRQGATKLLSSHLPNDISLSIIKTKGLPYLFTSHKQRLILLYSPIVIFILLFLSTQIIWHVNIIDADSETEKHLLSELKKVGVKKGAFKFTIDQSHVKNRILISNPDLLWIWVDIRGASAIVRYVDRTNAPQVFNEDTFYNIYSTHDAVVTRISATKGMAKVNVGDTVLKGQLLIEGSMPKDADNTKFIHASGDVWGNVWEEKVVSIPKKREIRTPTGEKIEHLSINFAKFRLKLFINSSILYPNYDIIEDNRTIWPIGVTFNKKEYHKVEVTYVDNDTTLMQKNIEEDFLTDLRNKGFTINYTESIVSDKDDCVMLTMRALCEEPIAKERRMNFGEDYSITDN